MAWQPEPQGLNELLNLLQDAIRPNNRDQPLVQQVRKNNDNSMIFLFIYYYSV